MVVVLVLFLGGYCHCKNSAVKFLCTVIIVNIVAYFSGNSDNVTTYVILVSIIIGVCNSGV